MIKADMHVHSKYSKHIRITTGLLTMVGARECYNELDDIYRVAIERGMNLMVVSDHDTIEGALIMLDKYGPEKILVAEELEVKAFNEGHLIHLLVYDINEEMHKDLTHLKRDGIESTIAYLRKRDIFYAIAHVAHSASDLELTPKLIDRLMPFTDTLEVRCAETLPEENRLTSVIADLYDKHRIAGSDAHILDSIGRVFTVSDKANNKKEFLQTLKRGECYIRGSAGNSLFRLTKESLIFIRKIYDEIFFHPEERVNRPVRKQWLDRLILAGLAPLVLTVLPVTGIAWNYQREQRKRVVKLQPRFLKFFYRKYPSGFKKDHLRFIEENKHILNLKDEFLRFIKKRGK